jgi:hypothetical protein
LSPHEFFLHSMPKNFLLKPLEEKEIELQFLPNKMGVVNDTLYFTLNTLFKIPIKVFAYVACTNKNKLPSVKGLGRENLERIK